MHDGLVPDHILTLKPGSSSTIPKNPIFELKLVIYILKSRRDPRSRRLQYQSVTFYRRKDLVCPAGIVVSDVRASIKCDKGECTRFHSDVVSSSQQTKDHQRRICTNSSPPEHWFSRGSSKYRGVTLHKCGRWEARMGQLLRKKYVYFGLFDSEIEAARAYDKAAIECNGSEAVTNLESSTYGAQSTLFNNDQDDKHHDLELNLSISSPFERTKGNDNIRSMQLYKATYELASNGKRSQEYYCLADWLLFG